MTSTPATGDIAFQTLVDAVVDYAIYMLDPEGHVTSWNRGALRIKQYEAQEILGRHFSLFYTPEDVARGIPATALRTARDSGRYEAEGWRLRKDGSRFWASVVIDAIRDDRGNLAGFAKVTRDVTEHREALLRMEKTREQLYEAQKMEALGQITGSAAHDYNNLLAAILGAAELGRRAAGDNPRLLRLLDGITAAAQRGAVVTQRLLGVARQQPQDPEVVDLGARIPPVVALLRHTLREDIGLFTDFPPGLAQVEVDAAQLELALLNLALNAREAMPGGGTLRVAAEDVTLDKGIEGLTGEYVTLSVSDTGIGIPAEVLPRIFDPFYTTKVAGRGTGLGLSQVRRFAAHSGGAVTAVSQPGEGTTVTIYLPARRAAVPAPPPATGRTPSTRRILVVEDDRLLAEYVDELLHEIGYATHVVHSGNEALAALENDPGFDLVFSDIVMPGGPNGVELAEKIAALHPGMPVLLTTGYHDNVATRATPRPFLPKPYRFDDLQSALARLFDGRAVN